MISSKNLKQSLQANVVKALRRDNGGEYLSREFERYLKSKGIQHELTVS